MDASLSRELAEFYMPIRPPLLAGEACRDSELPVMEHDDEYRCYKGIP
jgi:hypothetical protein